MKRWQIIVGIILILMGIFALLDQVFPDLRIARFVGPLILIGIGLLLILRPRIAGPGVNVHIPFLGDVRNTGIWEVKHHEYWWFVGSNRIDLTDAIFPESEGTIKIFGFVTDVKIIVPEDLGLRVESSGFLTDYKGLSGKQERFLSTLEDQSPNFLDADKRLNVQIVAFVSEINVRPSYL